MRDIQILQQILSQQCPSIHKKRLNSLILATETFLDGVELTLTKIGRALDCNTTVKHSIKRIDRLLENLHLHKEKILSISGMPALLRKRTHSLSSSSTGLMLESSYAT